MQLAKIPAGARELVASVYTKAPHIGVFSSEARAAYMLRAVSAVKNESAIHSLDSPKSPTFGLGLFPHLLVRRRDATLHFDISPTYILTPMMTLIAGAFDRINSYRIPEEENEATYRGSFSRNRAKLMSVINDPEHIEMVYETVAYVENRTVYFIKSLANPLDTGENINQDG